MDFETFLKDKKTVNAVIRSLEVMGEGIKRIPDEIRDDFIDRTLSYVRTSFDSSAATSLWINWTLEGSRGHLGFRRRE